VRMLDEPEYRHRTLPKGISFELQLDSQTVVLKPVDSGFSSSEPLQNPQLAIAASGEGTPFRLTLVRAATEARSSVDGDAMGKISRESSSKTADQRS